MDAKDSCALVSSEHDLDRLLKDNRRVMALFYASWCPFCRNFLPAFLKEAEGRGSYFLRVQDDREEMADRYAVKIYPTVLFFENGVVAKRLDGIPGVGLQDKHLAEFVRSCPLPAERDPSE
jgi:thiol-disulfide isomerase/thioredoxin